MLYFYIAENRIQFIFGFQSFIFYLSIAPTAIVRFKLITDKIVIAKYFLNLWKIFRLFSIYRVIKAMRKHPMVRVWFRLIFNLLLVLLIF